MNPENLPENLPQKEAAVIAVVAIKGGSGKSTTKENESEGLMEAGKKVLTIDGDRQSSLTMQYRYNPFSLEAAGKSLKSVLLEGKPIEDIIIKDSAKDNLGNVKKFLHPDLVPSWPALDDDQMILTMYEKFDRPEMRLAEVLKPIKPKYDFITIDTPGAMNIMTKNAMAAADGVVVVIDTELKAFATLPFFIRSFLQIRKQVNPTLRIIGILPTKFHVGMAQDWEILAKIYGQFGDTPMPDYLRPKRRGMRRMVEDILASWQERDMKTRAAGKTSIRFKIFDPIYHTTYFNRSSGTGISTLRQFPKAKGVAEYRKLVEYIMELYD